MSTKVTASRSIRFTRSGASYMMRLECDKGDLYQYYDGSTVTPVIDTVNSVTLTAVLSLSGSNGTVSDFDFNASANSGKYSLKWYLNSISSSNEIQFNSTTNISYGTAAGSNVANIFRRDKNKLIVQGSLKDAFAGQSGYVICVLTLTEDSGSTTEFQTALPAMVMAVTSNTWNVRIYSDSGSMTIKTHDTSSADSKVVLKARVFNGTTEVTTGFTFDWYRQDSTSLGGWASFASAGASSQTVNDGDVDSALLVRLDIKVNGAKVCSDMATVYDDADPYVIVPNPDPQDENIRETEGNSITYTPAVRPRDKQEVASSSLTGVTFQYYLYSAAGVLIIPMATGNTFTVTAANCIAAGGDVELVIVASF